MASDSQDQKESPVLSYPRRGKAGPGMFAGWYVTIGGINIVLGLATLGFAGLNLVASIIDWLHGPSGAFQFPMVAVILSLFAIATSLLVLVGSVGSFWRKRWVLKLVRAGFAGDLTMCTGVAVELMMGASHVPVMVLTAVGAGILLRVGWVVFALWAYSNLRADFYFEPRPVVERAQILPINMPVKAMPRLPKQPRGGFEIVGFDSTTFKPVRLTSRAPTEALARKFALTMGLAEESMQITRLGEQDSGWA